jgi:hypothetical protein
VPINHSEIYAAPMRLLLGLAFRAFCLFSMIMLE